jgi:Ca-activated chloride channel family protein
MKKELVLLLVAGAFFSLAHGFGSLKGRAPGTNELYVPLWLKTLDAKVTISDQIAVTFVDQVFVNTAASTKEGIFDFTLPEGSTVVQLALWINGKRQVAIPMEKTQATSQYDNSVRLSVDPALLTSLGNNEYQVNVYPLNAAGDSLAQRRIDFTYATPLKKISDTAAYFFQLMTANLSSQPPVRTSLSISVDAQDTIAGITAPGFSATELGITRNSAKSYTLMYGAENAYATKDLALAIAGTHSSRLRFTAATYVPGLDTTLSFDSTETASYFALWCTAPTPVSQTVKPREAVFVVDASYSMTGTKFTQLTLSLKHALGLLSPTDRFNIIAFNTTSKSFQPGLVAATPTNISLALAFLQTVQTRGITNANGPIKQAMASNWSVGAGHAIFLLTDGYANWPIRMSASQMIDTLTAANTAGARLFSVAMNDDADQTFLSLLSSQNDGALVTLTAADTAQGGLTATLEQLLYPLLYDIKLNVAGANAYDVYPATLPPLPDGGQLSVLGRYLQPGAHQVILSGKRDNAVVAETLSTALPVPKINYRSIPRVWAAAKVDYLLDQIRLLGEQPELKQGVITLGLKYGIVTPYTSLLVLETQPSPNNTSIIDKTNRNEIKTMQLAAENGRSTGLVRIRYAIPTAGGLRNVSLKIYNLRGDLLREIANHVSAGGWYFVNWDSKNGRGETLGAGTYILVLEAGNQRMAASIRLVR